MVGEKSPTIADINPMKMMILLGTTVFGWVGWWLGEQISDDITAALILSSIGTVFGVFAGWWAGRKMGV